MPDGPMRKLRTKLRELDAFRASVALAGIELDRDSGLAKRNGRFLRLGDVEVKLLDLFLSKPGTTFTRENLVALMWSAEAKIDLKTVDQKVSRLRKALTLGRAPNPIRSVRGQGYRFIANAGEEYAKWLEEGPRKLRSNRTPDGDGV